MYLKFECKLCIFNFDTLSERNKHIEAHFEHKNCHKCNKILIKIGDRWFEPHVPANCYNQGNLCTDETNSSYISFNFLTASALKNNSQIQDEKPDRTKPRLRPTIIDEIKYKAFVHENLESNENSYANSVNQEIEIKEANDDTRLLCDIKNEPPESNSTGNVQDISIGENSNPLPKVISGSLNKFSACNQTNSPAIVKKFKKPVKKSSNNSTNPKEPESGITIDEPKKFTCDICNKKINSHYQLQRHMNVNHIRSNTCDECGKTYASYAILLKHKEIHLDYRRYVCDLCGKAFRTTHILNSHKLIHSGERPHHCGICNKPFRTKTHVIAHMRIHSGLKPYKCSIENCDRSYMYKIDFKRHLYSAHGIYTKKYVCSICEKVYSENKLLKKHMECHGQK